MFTENSAAGAQGGGSSGGGGGGTANGAANGGGGSGSESGSGSDGEGGGGRARAKGKGAAGPSPADAARSLVGEMRAVGHIAVRSSSHEVILAVRGHAADWVADLTQSTLALGLAPPRTAPSDKPLLHPGVAALGRVFRAAGPALPMPAQLEDPEMPQPPSFMKRCVGPGALAAA